MKKVGKTKSEWNAAPASRRKGPGKGVTRDQLSGAIQRFMKQGGLIRTLPPQTASRGYSVGGSMDTGFENPSES
jgi:hypothetical protein